MDTGRSVLVVGTTDDALSSLAADAGDAPAVAALADTTPQALLERWESSGVASPSRIVTLGADAPTDCAVPVESASGPADLAAALRAGLEDRAEAAVYVDAVDAFADALGPERTFRLLHVLTRGHTYAGGSAYARAPPDADPALVDILVPLFDAVER
ncbi:hypothetical protein EFA46_004675 [Halarchaeum sp. CBA1220]|uniref:DUF7504 family protein n=1 Tax=Halarchaeum sp. CBA1220 TaxID=1853682 RepID=UPI000F3A98C2|nr:hypothetical protein [Halarchaeum sp. CBA1220]QLC33521.1 hypothetical protein EFA46_004675 [Halarchaeum sp. CBA1220]